MLFERYFSHPGGKLLCHPESARTEGARINQAIASQGYAFMVRATNLVRKGLADVGSRERLKLFRQAGSPSLLHLEVKAIRSDIIEETDIPAPLRILTFIGEQCVQ